MPRDENIPMEAQDADHYERYDGFGYTTELESILFMTEILTINAAGDTDDAADCSVAPIWHKKIGSWSWYEYKNETILDLASDSLFLADIIAFIAEGDLPTKCLRVSGKFLSTSESENTNSLPASSLEIIELTCKQEIFHSEHLAFLETDKVPNLVRLNVDGGDCCRFSIGTDPKTVSNSLQVLILSRFAGTLNLAYVFEHVASSYSRLQILTIYKCHVIAGRSFVHDRAVVQKAPLLHLLVYSTEPLVLSAFTKVVFDVLTCFTDLTTLDMRNATTAAEFPLRFQTVRWEKHEGWQKITLENPSSSITLQDAMQSVASLLPNLTHIIASGENLLFSTNDIQRLRELFKNIRWVKANAKDFDMNCAIPAEAFYDVASTRQKNIDNKGGTILLEDFDISVHIPRGAISEGTMETISFAVLKQPNALPLKRDEMVASFGFECAPAGMKFRSPIRVSLPHCAELNEPSSTELRLYSGEGQLHEEWKGAKTTHFTDVPLEKEGVRQYEVYEDKIVIYLDHFSRNWPVFKIPGCFMSRKRYGCLPFLPEYMPSGRKPILRVYLYPWIKGNKEIITDIVGGESEVRYRKVHPEVLCRIALNKELVSIRCVLDGEDQSSTRDIQCDDIRYLPKNCVPFKLDLTQRPAGHMDADISVEVKQHPRTLQSLNFNSAFSGNAISSPLSSTTPPVSPSHQLVTEEEIDEISKNFPNEKYIELCRELGYNYNRATNILVKHNKDYHMALLEIFMKWKTRTSGPRKDLIRALENAGAASLCDRLKP